MTSKANSIKLNSGFDRWLAGRAIVRRVVRNIKRDSDGQNWVGTIQFQGASRRVNRKYRSSNWVLGGAY